jgi:hypothetical protein
MKDLETRIKKAAVINAHERISVGFFSYNKADEDAFNNRLCGFEEGAFWMLEELRKKSIDVPTEFETVFKEHFWDILA